MVGAENIDAQIETANQKVQALTSEISGVQAELAAISADIQTAEQEAAAIQQKMADSQEKIAALKTEITNLEELIAKRTDKLKEQARAEQVENNFGNYVEVLLNSKSVIDAIERLSAISELVSANKAMLDQQVADKKEVSEKRQSAEQELNQQAVHAQELSDIQTSLATKLATREVYVTTLAAEKATTESEKTALLAKKEEAKRVAEELAKQEAERAKAQAQAKQSVQKAANAQTALNVVPTAANYQKPIATVAVENAVTNREEALKLAPTEVAQSVAPAPAEVAKPAVQESPAPAPASGKGAAIASAALAQLGVFQDCTMLVTNALRSVGINFHDWPAGYLSLGTVVPASQAQPGDLIYYANGGMGLAHIGVYIGNGQAVHGGWNGNQTAVASAYVGSGPVFIRVR